MSLSNMITLKKLDRLAHNAAVLGSLKKNEQVWAFGGRIVKSIAPDSCLKDKHSRFLVAVHHVVTAALATIFAIGRFLTAQSTEKNLRKIETLNSYVSAAINRKMPEPSTQDYHKALDLMKKMQGGLKKAAAVGLSNFKETCRSDERAKRIQGVINEQNDALLSTLDKRIAELESKGNENDVSRVEKILQRMTMKKSLRSTEVKQVQVSRRALKDALANKYGEKAIDRALDYYNLKGQSTLSGYDVAALIVGIVTNLTLEDVKEIYRLRGEESELGPFESLTEKQVCVYLSQIRDISCNLPISFKIFKYKSQLIHNINLLKTMSEYGEFDESVEKGHLKVQSLRKYSYTEFLARHFIYSLHDKKGTKFPEGLVFSMFDKDNNLILKQAGNLISKNGVFAAVIKQAKLNDPKEEVPVQVVFRGTYCNDSIFRDFSPFEKVGRYFFDGPGRSSFDKNKEFMLDKLFSACGGLENVQLEVMGHSLGACDTQRMVESIAYRLRDYGKSPISGISLYAFNSPNIEPDIANRFIESVKKLKIPIKLRYFDVFHDVVQECGAKKLGYCGWKHDTPKNLSISVFKLNRSLVDWLAARSKNFINKGKNFFSKSVQAHTFYSFKVHEPNRALKLNTTFIQDIFTNTVEDEGLSYGSEMDKLSKKVVQIQMDDQLVTKSARVGRKIKRIIHKILEALSFGFWKSQLLRVQFYRVSA